MNTIETFLHNRQNALSEQLSSYKENRELLDKILSQLEPLSTSVYFFDSLDFHITGNSSVLTSVFRALRTNGWTTTFNNPKVGDTSWAGFWYHEDCSICIWINFTSSVCKRVQVGTKLVEQPVYEVRCEDE